MFHKALWMRQWKQGKYIVLLFWLSSLYLLPYQYYSAAQFQLNMSKYAQNHYYQYFFNIPYTLFIQSAMLLLLACIFIGWERHTQSLDFLWAMPFKRKDIFLSKWLFGIVNIISVQIACWISMYIIYKGSFHHGYQTFTPFHFYFVYTTIVLIALYTFVLFIGSITGNIISQSLLSGICLCLPFGLPLLISGFMYVHSGDSAKTKACPECKYGDAFLYTSPLNPVTDLFIEFDYSPVYDLDVNGNIISSNLNKEPNHSRVPSAWKLLSPISFILLFLPLGAYLYVRSPNEQNGRIVLFPNLQKWFTACTILCFSLLGGRFFGGTDSLWGYYIGVLITSIISYVILVRLLKWKFSFNTR
ncbi:ABC transporter permease subunit [Bacillus pseudomycoides]|uniref:Acetoin ABC transporter permease n=1 Tax=Bacillus pseudomycoides TaxID=64104 RepID=A0A2C4XL62_9BACI|nr:ABC transporter permease subunit [Bacillus pseudomycoides]PDY48940.1 acetoin ABC transporter permease [Bacillus pseudomycoides]PED09941.1 acetoin ABC transporter permease [Bacillus pseudomycoides]PED70834.1 acetoin ABC transporter permease [Bacillus pseudomycoides]PEI40172.1 acetoin ABC transporter permease [Bacillus pseudomycoides]PEK29032.1 acetoin ABC transporter permease [Bacillus pseudomycoides]